MLVVTEFARVSGKMGAQFRFFGVGKMSLHDTDIANSWAGKWDKRFIPLSTIFFYTGELLSYEVPQTHISKGGKTVL